MAPSSVAQAFHIAIKSPRRCKTRVLPCCWACRAADGSAKSLSPVIRLDSHLTEVIVAMHVNRATESVSPRCLAMSGRAADHHALRPLLNGFEIRAFYIIMLQQWFQLQCDIYYRLRELPRRLGLASKSQTDEQTARRASGRESLLCVPSRSLQMHHRRDKCEVENPSFQKSWKFRQHQYSSSTAS